MGRKKTELYRVLKPGHLQAIGLVAAQWSLLELRVLSAIATISNVSLATAIILAGPSHFPTWMDMLRRLTILFPTVPQIDSRINRIKKKFEEVAQKRNQVVHAAWMQEPPKGLLSIGWDKPKLIATGTGLPKSGKNIVIPLQMTAADIREIRREIEEAEKEFVAWLNQRIEWTRRLSLAQALLANPNNPSANQNMPRNQLPPSHGLFGPLPPPEKKQ